MILTPSPLLLLLPHHGLFSRTKRKTSPFLVQNQTTTRLQTPFTKLVRNLPDTFIRSTLQVYLTLAGHPVLTTVQPSPCCIDERLPVPMPDTCMAYPKVHLSIPIPLQITFLLEMT